MSELLQIEQQMDMHKAEMQHHALEFCKLVSHIYLNASWNESPHKGFKAYMKARWGIEKDNAYDLAKIGRELSEISDNDLNVHQLLALANVKPELRQATFDVLSIIPDEPTAKAITLLAEIVEEGVTTGALETTEGGQIVLNKLDAILPAYLLATAEKHARRIAHQTANRPAPVLTLPLMPLGDILNFSSYHKIFDRDTPATAEVTRHKNGITIRVLFVDELERV